ncbi:MFS general substrate transporter [Tolypocladium paradoxum]|uniref:MFS general substrate transporter n=1 Tax=Tolypocladium paradoxum TaxID=94208 RepID=A0A2S4KLF1_9HYPO|nr:MFS general substrate transporter [Tolypocladium paradoxum]
MRRPLSVDLSIRDISCSMGSYDDGSLQWVPTAYAQSFGGFLMAGGCLGHLCMTRLVSSGAFQGFAAACTIPCAQSLVALSFEDPQARGAAGSTGFCFRPHHCRPVHLCRLLNRYSGSASSSKAPSKSLLSPYS